MVIKKIIIHVHLYLKGNFAKKSKIDIMSILCKKAQIHKYQSFILLDKRSPSILNLEYQFSACRHFDIFSV